MFKAQSGKPLPARPRFIHSKIQELVQQGWKSNTWARGKTRKLRSFSCARAVPHRRNATSALDSARDGSSGSSRSASRSPRVECTQTQMEALQKWAALNASTFPEKLLLTLKRGERGVRCRLCSRGVGLMSELCWSAAGIYTRAIRWEMEMEVLNFIHQKSPGNNIGREWFIDAVIRLSVSFFLRSRLPPCFLRNNNLLLWKV